MDKEKKMQIKFVTKLPAGHKYFPELNNITANLDNIYTNPQNPKKLMLKFPHPSESGKDAYLSVKHIEIINASWNNIQLYTIKQMMDLIVDSNLKMPIRLLTMNPFREESFQAVTLLYVSDVESKAFLATKEKQTMKPLDHLRHNLFIIPKKQEE